MFRGGRFRVIIVAPTFPIVLRVSLKTMTTEINAMETVSIADKVALAESPVNGRSGAEVPANSLGIIDRGFAASRASNIQRVTSKGGRN